MENGELGEDVLGLATITVSSVGKISGKFHEGGTNWTLSAACYTAATSAAAPGGADPAATDTFICSNVVATYTYKVTKTVKGKKKTVKKTLTRTFVLTVAAPVKSAFYQGGVAKMAERRDGGVAPGLAIEAWQNLWGSTYKAVGKKQFYTSKKKPYRTFTVMGGTAEGDVIGLTDRMSLSLKVTPAGAVTATLSYDTGKTKKAKKVYYKPTCSSVAISTSATDPISFGCGAFLYFAPSAANGFNGYADWVPFVEHGKVQLWEGGPYWATNNIGAEKPEDYGLYFWWGDTVGYRWENERFVANDGSSSGFSFDSDNVPANYKDDDELIRKGWIGGDHALVPEHDAAQVHWGNGWRMPTVHDMQCLIDNCDWTPTTVNDVAGFAVRGRGDYASACIFLPYAGEGGKWSSLRGAGSYGIYWSSNPYNYCLSFYDYGSHELFFTDSPYAPIVSYYERYYGLPIRPVQDFAK